MSRGHLSTLAPIVAGRLHGADAAYCGVSTDTRSLRQGELFVALRGPNFDAHEFLEVARERGAAGALVEQLVDVDLPQVEVLNTLDALASMAAAWRVGLEPLVVGVTGSNGKTTVKEMIAAILRERMPTLATGGNLNNHIGLPLTLLRLTAEHRAAVIEMGTSGPGEIAALAALTRPQVALVTNATAAHLQGLGTVENVAREKGAIFTALPPDGTAVINADDTYAQLWREMADGRPVLSFGRADGADFRVADLRPYLSGYDAAQDGEPVAGIRFNLRHHGTRLGIELALAGEHNAVNAAGAAAAAWAVGADDGAIRDGLASVRPVRGRLQLRRAATGGWLLDDTYNANPASVCVAVKVLRTLPGNGWLVLGDMGELGDAPEARHAAIGELARAAGVTHLYSLGPLSAHAAAAFGENGEAFDELEELLIVLRAHAGQQDNILVKGSRSARMERVVGSLLVSTQQADSQRGETCSST